MAIDITKTVTGITYNGNPMTLAGITPQGKITITENGTDIDVSQYALADVNVSGGGGILPAGYAQMEYLESSGTQYIDTGRVITMATELAITTQWYGGQSGYHSPIGCSTPSLYMSSSSGVRTARIYYGFGDSGEKSTGSLDYLPLRARNTIKMSADKLESYAEGILLFAYTNTATEVVGENTLYVFGRNNSTNDRWVGRIYDFEWKENGVTVLHFIPAMRDSDQVLGMYDIVNNAFYTNAGTGTFTGGAF